MEVLDTVKGTFNTAVEALTNVAQDFVEKNRTKAKLNRLRMVMKSESELMNRAYIALGKEYYDRIKNGDCADTAKREKLLEVIDNCKAKIARARDCYRTILESQNEFVYSSPSKSGGYNADDVVDITVACSNESDYPNSPFQNAPEGAERRFEEAAEATGEKAESAKERFNERMQKAKDTVEEKVEQVKDAVEEKVGKAKTAVGEKVAKAAETVKEKAEKFAESAPAAKAEEAAEAVEEKVEDVKEAVEEKAEEVKEAVEEAAPDTESDDDELF